MLNFVDSWCCHVEMAAIREVQPSLIVRQAVQICSILTWHVIMHKKNSGAAPDFIRDKGSTWAHEARVMRKGSPSLHCFLSTGQNSLGGRYLHYMRPALSIQSFKMKQAM